MINGGVGIASRTGLCRFQIERSDTLRRIHQVSAINRSGSRVGFWAVLAEEDARHIVRLVGQGKQRKPFAF